MDDPEEPHKFLPKDELQLHLFWNEFESIIKEYDKEYDFIGSYVQKFALVDKIRILQDIKSFPIYILNAVKYEMSPRGISNEAEQMIKAMQWKWLEIYERIRRSAEDGPFSRVTLSWA